jgi:hypothetical protein
MSSSGVLGALYCSAPGVPVVGLLQARRERKRGFQVPGVVAEGVVLRCVCVLCVVTEPPKIIPYYRLSRSTWPLSNNKELLSRFRQVKPGKSHTTGSLICAKPTRRRDQSTTLRYIKGSQVRHYYKPGFSYIKVNMIRV